MKNEKIEDVLIDIANANKIEWIACFEKANCQDYDEAELDRLCKNNRSLYEYKVNLADETWYRQLLSVSDADTYAYISERIEDLICKTANCNSELKNVLPCERTEKVCRVFIQWNVSNVYDVPKELLSEEMLDFIQDWIDSELIDDPEVYQEIDAFVASKRRPIIYNELTATELMVNKSEEFCHRAVCSDPRFIKHCPEQHLDFYLLELAGQLTNCERLRDWIVAKAQEMIREAL